MTPLIVFDVPFLFENSASDSISKLNDVLKKRKERLNLDDH